MWGYFRRTICNKILEEIPSEEASTLQIGSAAFPPGQCTSPHLHPCQRLFDYTNGIQKKIKWKYGVNPTDLVDRKIIHCCIYIVSFWIRNPFLRCYSMSIWFFILSSLFTILSDFIQNITHTHSHTHTHKYTRIYIYIFKVKSTDGGSDSFLGFPFFNVRVIQNPIESIMYNKVSKLSDRSWGPPRALLFFLDCSTLPLIRIL